jgi:hypothetical protein
MGTYEVPCHWELALWTQEIVTAMESKNHNHVVPPPETDSDMTLLCRQTITYQVERHFRFVCQSDYFCRALQGLFYGSIRIYIGSTSHGRRRRHGPLLRECIHAYNIYIDVHTCVNDRTFHNCSLLQNVNQNGSTTTVRLQW